MAVVKTSALHKQCGLVKLMKHTQAFHTGPLPNRAPGPKTISSANHYTLVSSELLRFSPYLSEILRPSEGFGVWGLVRRSTLTVWEHSSEA